MSETDSSYLNDLNPQQRAAVEYISGPQLVIAGAGSGKTRVLTYKIVHLLANGYEPWRLVALTFTNKAAREMRERIEQLTGNRTASQLWMGTFHSIFAKLLRRHADRLGYKPNFTIYDAADSKSLLKSIIKDMDLDDKLYKVSTVMSAISTAKNALISPGKYAINADLMEADRRARRPRLHEIYRVYRDRCFNAGAMDFDDLLYYMNILLRDNPDLLSHYQEFFRYLLVDEYQDTNFAQHNIVSMLCRRSGRICVVGDDAQSIYSFRGANITNILNLKREYPSIRTFKLEQNYRSTQNIIGAANTLIEKNTRQIPKQVFSTNSKGNLIEVVQSYSDYEEGYVVANRISQVRMRTHDSLEEFAILYRTNAQSRVLEESLRKRNIPYRIYGGLSFYQRKEVKDVIAYLRLAVNPDDDEALRRVINVPGRGIGDTTVNRLLRRGIEDNCSIWSVICSLESDDAGLKSAAIRKVTEFGSMIEEFVEANQAGRNADEMARLIVGRTRLLAMLLTERTPENLSKQENINELLAGAKEFVENRTEEGSEAVSLNDFLAEVSLATDQDKADEGEAMERVTMMTVHAAKGLEFNNVFIVGVERDLFPSAMACNSLEEMEEERRLLYVAITRARNFCMMSYATTRYRNGQTCATSPSPFISDIDPQYLKIDSTALKPLHTQSEPSYNRMRQPAPAPPPNLRPLNATSASAPRRPSATTEGNIAEGIHTVNELAEGLRIEHSRFGKGTIVSIDTSMPEARIKVEFDSLGTRVLLLKFARFTIVS